MSESLGTSGNYDRFCIIKTNCFSGFFSIFFSAIILIQCAVTVAHSLSGEQMANISFFALNEQKKKESRIERNV